MQKRTTLITVIGIVIFIIVPLTFFFLYAMRSLLFVPHGYISPAAIPSPVHVTTKGRSATLQTDQKYPVEVGANTLVFSADGFQSKTVHLTIKKDETTIVPVQLTPITDAAKKEVSDQKYQSTRQKISDFKMNTEAADLKKDNPILSELPISTYDYTITPCNQAGSTIDICITSFIPGTTYMQQNALDKLKSLGYDLSKYKIYVDGSLYTGSVN